MRLSDLSDEVQLFVHESYVEKSQYDEIQHRYQTLNETALHLFDVCKQLRSANQEYQSEKTQCMIERLQLFKNARRCIKKGL